MQLVKSKEDDAKLIEYLKIEDSLYRSYDLSIGDNVKVNENQAVVVIQNGAIQDVETEPGIYKLKSIENTKEDYINNWKINLRDADDIGLVVLFFNCNTIENNKYNILKPIKYKNWKNNKYQNIKVNLIGHYNFEIVDIKMFLKQVVGIRTVYTKQEVIERIRNYIISSIEIGINEVAEEYKLDINDLPKASKELEVKLKKNKSDEDLLRFGIKLTYFDISGITVNRGLFNIFK